MATLVDLSTQEVLNRVLDTTKNALAVSLDTEQSGVVQTVKISQTTIDNDVDIISVVPGTGATNLEKAIDAVTGATDTGVVPLGIRDDALSTLTPIEEDYVLPRTDANGALWARGDITKRLLSLPGDVRRRTLNATTPGVSVFRHPPHQSHLGID